jgi:sulfite exporter TauE/SafE
VSVVNAFVTGLLAGGASCAAVQGGLLAGLVARQRVDVPDARTSARSAPSSHQRGKSAPRHPTRRSPAVATEASWSATVSADLVPVAAFLGGKLVSHTAAGAALGLVGSLVQLDYRVRAGSQVLAGALMVALALAQLGVRGFRRFTVSPPARFARVVRRTGKSESAFAPAVLGLATVLIPCGVTLSMAALAATSGSVVTGAAIMAMFVLGTSPLFALIGYAARRSASVLRGRLAHLTAAVVLAIGLVTVNTGLVIAGSPVTAGDVARALTPAGGSAQAHSSAAVSVENGRQTVVINALSGGYAPEEVTLDAGIPTTLVVKTDGTRGCTRAFVIPAARFQTVLPETGETPLDFGVLQPGRITFTCAMGMYTGTIIVR